MMYRAYAALLALVLAPLFVAAQTGDVPPDAAGASYCPNLTINMHRCRIGNGAPPLTAQRCADTTTQGQVTKLQTFLVDYYDLPPEDYITGYFGRRTEERVQQFQREHNLIPPAGYVGPITRAKIAQVCGGNDPVTPPPPTNMSCSFNGQRVPHGGGVTAYYVQYPDQGQSCLSQTRTCTNGVLSGTYLYASCYPANPQPPAQPHSCTSPWGTTIQSGTSVTAYQSSTVTTGNSCISQTRTCTNGSLSGSYTHASCSVTTSCTPLSPETQTLACPSGQTGSITETRTSSCPGPTWGAWTTTSNTCSTTTTYSWYTGEWSQCTNNQQTRTVQCKSNTGAVVADSYCTGTKPDATKSCGSTTSNVGSCTYQGQTYSEGQSVTHTWAGAHTTTVTCDNSVWIDSRGINACHSSDFLSDRTAFSCTAPPGGQLLLGATPRHGNPPLTVTISVINCTDVRSTYDGHLTMTVTSVNWGDGSSEGSSSIPSKACLSSSDMWSNMTHTYTAGGSYTITASGVHNGNPSTNSASIRVGGATASANNASQLAAAYTALVSLLEQMVAAMK